MGYNYQRPDYIGEDPLFRAIFTLKTVRTITIVQNGLHKDRARTFCRDMLNTSQTQKGGHDR